MQLIAPGKAVSRLLLLKLLMVMKLTAFFIIIATFQVSAKSYAQKVTITGKDLTLDKVFRIIRKETGYQFIYDQALLDKAGPVTLNVKDAPIGEVLAQCLKEPGLAFSIRNGAIVIYKEPEIITALADDPAAIASIEIHGTVMDSTGAPLAGANIIIQGTKTGTHTDNRGHFILHNVSDGATLIISFTGYESRVIHVRDNKDLFVNLRTSAQPLDEQIVQAYGTTTRRFNVGSISKVSAEEIASQPVVNPLAALEGRVPGLLVTTNTGNPGASFNIQIRGQNTINSAPGSNLVLDNPLFIVDGVPFAPQNGSASKLQTVDDINRVQTTSTSTGLSPFNSLNPSDIESIEVLKDADATAIYGARGANGVILITTKRGKATKTTLNGMVYTGINHITRSLPLLNTQQYLKMRHEAFANDGITPNTTAGSPGYAPDLLTLDTTSYTNFVNTLFGKNALTTSGNLSISGGSSTNTFFIGAGYDRQTYVFPGSYADNRISGNVALHHGSIDRKLSIDLTTQYSYDHNMVPGTPSILSAFTLVPDLPSLRNPNGSLRWYYNGIGLSTILNSFNNPLAYLNQSDNVQVYNQNSNLLLSYQLLQGLTARVSLGYSNFISDEYSKYPSTAQNPAYTAYPSATASNSSSYTWIIEPQINYVHAFGKGRLNLLVGNTDEKMAANNLTVTGTGYSNDLLLNSISAAGAVTSQQTYTPYKYSGSFGRINYIYDNKYIVDVTGRMDGSSRFIPGRQWGKFGAVGAGWIFTEEALLKRALPSLSYGKIRGSYGTTGNDNVGNYQYISNWQTQSSSYVYGGSIGYIPQNLDNPNYSWSITKKLEGGLETGWFANRLLFSAAWYRDRSGNQLIQYSLPAQTGFNYVTKNFQAVLQNTGWEFAVTSSNIKKKDFSWTTSLNLSIPHNKLIAFPGLAASPYGYTYAIGRPISTVLGYKYAGINDTTGVYQFYTTKGARTYLPSATNGDNKFAIGNPDPKFYGGMRNTFSYKGFSLDIFLEFRKQSGFNYLSSINSPFGYMFNVPVDALNTWKQPGDHAAYQKLTSQSYSAVAGSAASVFSYFHGSSATYSDASYLRFKTLGLSYALSNAVLKKAKMNSCKVFVNAQNLFIITKYKGNDPETQNYYGTPPMRTVAGGLQFNF
jgi:TonB-dependent starch-binding outer membrane protein SusC